MQAFRMAALAAGARVSMGFSRHGASRSDAQPLHVQRQHDPDARPPPTSRFPGCRLGNPHGAAFGYHGVSHGR